MTFVKINETLYPAIIIGRKADNEWDSRASKSITLEMTYEESAALFVDGLAWSIVQRAEVPKLDENGVQTGTEIRDTEYDNSDYNLAGDITDHRDGTITVKMGKLTELEEAYELMFGDVENDPIVEETAPSEVEGENEPIPEGEEIPEVEGETEPIVEETESYKEDGDTTEGGIE